MIFFGISGDTLSLVTQIVAFIMAFVLGVSGRPKALLQPLIGLGIVADLVGQFFFAGGGPGACVGLVVLPVFCLISGYIGRGIW